MTGPLIRRQYAQRNYRLDDTLTRNLLWRYSAIGNLPPRATPFSVNESVGAHTDANGYGHIAEAHTLNGPKTVSARLPDWLLRLEGGAESESPISNYELCAAVLTACVALSWRRTAPSTCVLCVDNQAAVAASVKGRPASHLGALLVSLFWSLAALCSTPRRAEYVNAKSNIPDAPSRACSYSIESTCALQKGEFPAVVSEVSKSMDTIHREASLVSEKGKD